jgi:hypothetical protein
MIERPLLADSVEKVFFADDWKFSGPLVCLTRCDVRDRIKLPQKRLKALVSILQSGIIDYPSGGLRE